MTNDIDLDQALQEAAGGRPRLLTALRRWRLHMPDALLQAAVLPDATQAQIQSLDLDADLVAHRQLLPHLHFSRSAQLRTHPLEPTLRAARLRTGLANKRLITERNDLLARLQARDATVIVFKGADLAYSVYPNPCCRKVGDIDLLVAEDSYAETAEVLKTSGWAPINTSSGFMIGEVLTPGSWFNPDVSVTLDVHWTAAHHARWVGASRPHFTHAVSQPNGAGGTYLGLCPEHGLEQVCSHGLAQNDYPPVRWAADATWILRTAGDTFDWDRLIATARVTHSAPILIAALRYLQLALDADIPESVFADLRHMPCRNAFRAAWSYRLDDAQGPRDRISGFLFRFRERNPDDSVLRATSRLPAFMRDSQSARTATGAFGLLVRKAVLNKFG